MRAEYNRHPMGRKGFSIIPGGSVPVQKAPFGRGSTMHSAKMPKQVGGLGLGTNGEAESVGHIGAYDRFGLYRSPWGRSSGLQEIQFLQLFPKLPKNGNRDRLGKGINPHLTAGEAGAKVG